MVVKEVPRPSADSKAEHKIQSGHGTLSLEMDQVPKVLRPLVQEWIPEGYVVSFKVGLLCVCVRLPRWTRPPACLQADVQGLMAGLAALEWYPGLADEC